MELVGGISTFRGILRLCVEMFSTLCGRPPTPRQGPDTCYNTVIILIITVFELGRPKAVFGHFGPFGASLGIYLLYIGVTP